MSELVYRKSNPINCPGKFDAARISESSICNCSDGSKGGDRKEYDGIVPGETIWSSVDRNG